MVCAVRTSWGVFKRCRILMVCYGRLIRGFAAEREK